MSPKGRCWITTILPFAGFMVSDRTEIEPLTGQPWNFWIVVVVATLGNTVGSIVGYAIGAYGGRPFLERYGRYLLIRPHEIELADQFFQRYGAATAFFSRLLPVVRTFISFPAGVARMHLGKFIVYSTLGALPWSIALVYAGEQLGSRWVDIRHALQPFDLAIAVAVVAGVLLFIWWRLGMPGRPRRSNGGRQRRFERYDARTFAYAARWRWQASWGNSDHLTAARSKTSRLCAQDRS